jgi:outer membrane protein assembly factor BamB
MMRFDAGLRAVLLIWGACLSGAALAQTAPTLSVTPRILPPTTDMTVSGTGFTPYESVGIYLDRADLREIDADATGDFSSATVELPASVVPGKHYVTGVGQISKKHAQTTILARTNWPLSGFTPRRVRYNPYENVLNSGDVPNLAALWVAKLPDFIRSSPAVASGLVFIGSHTNYEYAYNANTGALVWKAPTGGEITSSATVANGLVYVGSADQYFYAFNSATGATVWSALTPSGISSSAVVGNGLVYIVSSNSVLYAYDAATGAPAWSASIGKPPAGSGTNGPTLGNGEVLKPFNAYGSPSLDGQTLVVGSGNQNVYAFNAVTGAQLWATETGNWVNASPTISGGVVYIGSWDGNLYALSEATGAVLWATPLNGVVVSSVAIANGVLYVGSGDHNLYSLDAATGAVLWTAPTNDVIVSSPSVAGGVVFVGSIDDSIYAFDASSGAKLWSYATTFFCEGSPAVVNGVVYEPSMNGYFYALSVNGTLPGATAAVDAASLSHDVRVPRSR